MTLENGGIIKSIHGDLYKNSVWYSMYGSKGRVECPREDANAGHISCIYVNSDDYSGEYKKNSIMDNYMPVRAHDNICKCFGHGGSDYYVMYNFIEKILGHDADTIDVYEALDMFLPGLFAYRLILNREKQMDIPNLRNKSERNAWRNDTACTDINVAGEMLLPTCVTGTPDIDDKVYEAVKLK